MALTAEPHNLVTELDPAAVGAGKWPLGQKSLLHGCFNRTPSSAQDVHDGGYQ